MGGRERADRGRGEGDGRQVGVSKGREGKAAREGGVRKESE